MVPIMKFPLLHFCHLAGSLYGKLVMLTCKPSTQQTQNICIIFLQCWPSVEDVGQTLLLETKCVFKHQDLQMFGLKLNKYE